MFNHIKNILGEQRFNEILEEAEERTYEEILDDLDTYEYAFEALVRAEIIDMNKVGLARFCDVITKEECDLIEILISKHKKGGK